MGIVDTHLCVALFGPFGRHVCVRHLLESFGDWVCRGVDVVKMDGFERLKEELMRAMRCAIGMGG